MIVQASRGARKYTNDNFLRHLMLAAAELYPEIPIVMHQDHGNVADTCISAIRMGFTSVMMDGSLEDDGKTPASYEYNVAVTREVVNIAHRFGVSVEGELGCLGSLEHGTGEKEDGHGAEGKLSLDQLLTDPDQAVDFVKRTGIDALAVAMGTSHGAYKFSRKPTGDVLAMDRIEEIHSKIPNCHLVMHGSSSVPKDLSTRSTSTAARSKRPTACRSKRSSAASGRRSQDQRRHRQPPRDHRRHPQGFLRQARRVRSALLSDPGPRRDAEDLRRAHEAVRPGRPGRRRAARLARPDGARLRGRQIRRKRQARRARDAPQGQGRRRVRDGALVQNLAQVAHRGLRFGTLGGLSDAPHALKEPPNHRAPRGSHSLSGGPRANFRLVADRIVNLSQSGMVVTPANPVLTGERLIASFKLPRSGAWIDVEATVTRVAHGRRSGDTPARSPYSSTSSRTARKKMLEHHLRKAPASPPCARPGRRNSKPNLHALVQSQSSPALWSLVFSGASWAPQAIG